MRKYIKNMRQQNENKSLLFKQAKKMFHYQPNSQTKPFSYSKPSKTHNRVNTKQFKDDFSSVKDNRAQNNQINESSWIGRLVNGIQDHSLQDLRVYSKQIEKRLSDSVQNIAEEKKQNSESEKIMIVDQRKQTKAKFQQKANKPMDVEAPTKKNSINISKKKSDTFTEKKFKLSKKKNELEQNQIAEKQNVRSVSRSKDQSRSLSRNISQSVIAKTEVSTKKELGSKKKSLQNINIYKGTQQSKSKVSINEDNCKIQALKPAQRKTYEKDKSQKAKAQDIRFNESISEMQQIKCLTDNKMEVLKQTDNRQKATSLLDDSFSEPLFQQSSKNKLEQVQVQKKIGFGLIRKNKKIASNRQEKTSVNHSLKFEQMQTKVSPKFSSNPLNNKITKMYKNQNWGQEDFISARQQKQLVDKYLRKDYSFKCYTSKNTDSESIYAKQLGIKKNSQRKYNYQYDQNRHSKIERKPLQHLRQDMHYNRSYKTEQNTHNPTYQYIQTSAKNQAPSKNFCYKKEKYSSLPNRRSQPQRLQIQQTKPYKIVEIAENQSKITKEAYLHDSIDSTLADISSVGFKYEQFYQLKGKAEKNKQHLKPSNPSKYFYLIQNSTQKEGDRLNLCQKENSFRKKDFQSIDGSGKLIDRLNSKLSTYINQHQLIKQEAEPEEWNVGEATYRTVRLNFNQLKKHR